MVNKTLINAAKYLASNRGFNVEQTGDPMFDSPLVALTQRDTFDALHLLSCAATDANPALVNVKRVTEWLKVANV